jgi:hypothetical protein
MDPKITAVETEPDPGAAVRLEYAIRLYTEHGFPLERMIQQLIQGGHDRDRVRRRFPDVPESAIPRRLTPESAPRERVVDPLPAHEVPPRLTGPTRAGALLTREPSRLITAGETAIVDSASFGESPLDGISFQYVPLIQCSFPHADPGDETTFTRRNGWLELTLSTDRPETGLPYGVPARLLTIYAASEAVRTRTAEIFLGRSVHDFLRLLDVPITRGERGSLRVYANQLLRLLHCSFTIDENIEDERGRKGLHIRRALFAEEARLWWDESEGVGQGSSLVLSQPLFQSILERSAPLSTSAIRQLRKSPMDLDVYAWLVHRLFHLGRPSTITWPQLSAQFGHGYRELRKFRRFFSDSLKRVLVVYPEAKLRVGDQGVMLLPSKPHLRRGSPR